MFVNKKEYNDVKLSQKNAFIKVLKEKKILFHELKTGKKNHKVDIEKFKMATNFK